MVWYGKADFSVPLEHYRSLQRRSFQPITSLVQKTSLPKQSLGWF